MNENQQRQLEALGYGTTTYAEELKRRRRRRPKTGGQ